MHDHGWIDTLEGGHIVCPGDWIITGVKGERYPCKPDVFAMTYEPAPAALDAPPATTDGQRPARSEAEAVQNPDVEGSRGETKPPLTFKSPFRNDMTVDVLDVLSALESWARSPRLGGSHSFTYGELEIGARMAREALSASPASPTVGGWLRADRLLYTLEQDGWRRGEPVMRNRLMVRVEADVRSAEAERDAEALTAALHAWLNRTAPHRDPHGLKAEGE
jgi:hypothetical protein